MKDTFLKLISGFLDLNPYIRKLIIVSILSLVLILFFTDTNRFLLSIYNTFGIRHFFSRSIDLWIFKCLWGVSILWVILKLKKVWSISQAKKKWDNTEFPNIKKGALMTHLFINRTIVSKYSALFILLSIQLTSFNLAFLKSEDLIYLSFGLTLFSILIHYISVLRTPFLEIQRIGHLREKTEFKGNQHSNKKLYQILVLLWTPPITPVESLRRAVQTYRDGLSSLMNPSWNQTRTRAWLYEGEPSILNREAILDNRNNRFYLSETERQTLRTAAWYIVCWSVFSGSLAYIGFVIGMESMHSAEIAAFYGLPPERRIRYIESVRRTAYYRLPYQWRNWDRLESQLDSEGNFLPLRGVDSGV